MNGPCEIVRYRPEHKEAVARLQTVLWSPDAAANRRYFEWKYEANPWVDEPRVWLGLRGDDVVGMRGFYESRWQVGSPGHVVPVPLADDFAIAVSERSSGLATQIMQTALADLASSGVEYAFTLSAGQVTMLGSLAQGWRSAGRHEPLARREPGPAWLGRLRARIRHARLVWRWADAPLLRSAAERRPFHWLDRAPSPPGLSIGRERRPAEIAELCAAQPNDGRLRHVRSQDYLAWRFANPMHDYRFLYAEQDGRLAGCLVLRARVMGLAPTAQVAIAELVGRDSRVRGALLAAAIDAGRFIELVVWGARIGAEERALLRERGFAPLDPARDARGYPCALLRSTRGTPASEWQIGGRALLDPVSWDLRMLDSMAG
jgi:Acetyltransferase (GNAT) domain